MTENVSATNRVNHTTTTPTINSRKVGQKEFCLDNYDDVIKEFILKNSFSASKGGTKKALSKRSLKTKSNLKTLTILKIKCSWDKLKAYFT